MRLYGVAGGVKINMKVNSTHDSNINDTIRIPSTIWMLGLTSLFMDVSTEIVHSVMPIYLVTVLGASPMLVGAIDGVAEATASIMKVFSGALSDWVGRRKPLAIAGYGMAAITRPILPFASTVTEIFALRILDRIGKGVRVAPRDALVADHVRPEILGAAYGLRQGLDTIGALVGPIIAAIVLASSNNDFQWVFWVSCIPAALCVLIISLGVSEAARPADRPRPAFPLRPSQVRRLRGVFWGSMAIIMLLLIPRFSEGFLLLKAQQSGISVTWVPLLLAAVNLVAAPVSFPAGRLSDRIGRRHLVMSGFAVLVAAQLVLTVTDGPIGVLVGALFWGLHLGMTQGVLAAMIVDHAPADLRGTAFGVFHVASGLAVLVGSFGAGWIWDQLGSTTMFATAAAIGVAGLAALVISSVGRR